MNLSVGSVCQREIQIVIPVSCVLSVIDDVPYVNVSLTALEVPKNLRALTKIKLNGGSGVSPHIKSCGNGAGNIRGSICFFYRAEAETVKATESFIGCSKNNIIITKTDLLCNTVDFSGSLDGDLRGLTERNGNNRLLEVKGIGSSDVNGLFTDNIPIVDHLSGYGTFDSVGGKDTVCNGTHSLFLNSPLYVGGNIHLGTNSVGTESVKGDRAAGGVEIIVSRHSCTGKHTVCGRSRYNQNSVGGWTLTAVGQRAVNLQVFTGTLRAEGSRTTTVTVSGDDTTHLDHVLSHFIRGETGGVGSLLTVGNGDHKTTVRPNTNEGSGCDTGAVIFPVLIHGITIGIGLDQESEQYGDRLLFPAGQRIGRTTNPGLGHIRRSFFTGNGVLVVVDNNNGLNTTGLKGTVGDTAVAVILTIQDGVTKRLTNEVRILLVVSFGVPAQGAVGRNDYVTVTQLFCFKSLGRSGLNTVVTLLRPHTLCARDDLNKFVVNVNNRCMEYLSASTGIVVQNLLVLFNTGSDIPFFFGNNIVIVTSAVAVVINTCCYNTHRKRSNKH